MDIKLLKTRFRFYHNLYNQTAHSVHRTSRFIIAEGLEPGYKRFIGFFIVNRNHPGGKEVHAITEHGIVYIFNLQTEKLITCLIARPEQLKKYFDATGLICPNRTYRFAKRHQEKKLNN